MNQIIIKLQEYGLTLEEAESTLKKYSEEIVDLAIRRAPFKNKDCLRQSLRIILKYYL